MITKKRQERLWAHLMEWERIVGSPLRTEPRSYGHCCPIMNFSPNVDRAGNSYLLTWDVGDSVYGDMLVTYHRNYDKRDTNWWCELSIEDRFEVTEWLIKKIKGKGGRKW